MSKFSLPKSQILSLIRQSLPENTVVKGESTEFIQKAAVVFIMYLTAAASDGNEKKTLDWDRVVAALGEIGFEGFKEEVEKTLEAFDEQQKEKKREKESKVAEKDSNSEEPKEAETGSADAAEAST